MFDLTYAYNHYHCILGYDPIEVGTKLRIYGLNDHMTTSLRFWTKNEQISESQALHIQIPTYYFNVENSSHANLFDLFYFSSFFFLKILIHLCKLVCNFQLRTKCSIFQLLKIIIPKRTLWDVLPKLFRGRTLFVGPIDRAQFQQKTKKMARVSKGWLYRNRILLNEKLR